MELSIGERLLLNQILPQQGNIVNLRIIGDLKRELSFTEEEVKDCNIRQDGEMVRWDNDNYRKECQIGKRAHSIISASLKQISDEEKLTPEMIALYDLFVEKEE